MSRIPLIPESGPFTTEQRLWPSGFLAGGFSDANAGASPSLDAVLAAAGGAHAKAPLLLLYGRKTVRGFDQWGRLACVSPAIVSTNRTCSTAPTAGWFSGASMRLDPLPFGPVDLYSGARRRAGWSVVLRTVVISRHFTRMLWPRCSWLESAKECGAQPSQAPRSSASEAHEQRHAGRYEIHSSFG